MTKKELLNRFHFTFYTGWSFARDGSDFMTPERQQTRQEWDANPENPDDHKVKAVLEISAEEWLRLMEEAD